MQGSVLKVLDQSHDAFWGVGYKSMVLGGLVMDKHGVIIKLWAMAKAVAAPATAETSLVPLKVESL
jgi:hypothetical protein